MEWKEPKTKTKQQGIKRPKGSINMHQIDGLIDRSKKIKQTQHLSLYFCCNYSFEIRLFGKLIIWMFGVSSFFLEKKNQWFVYMYLLIC